MRFPWISRAAHDEVVAVLRQEIADRKEEARKIMDLFTYRATGEKVFYPEPRTEEQKEPRNVSDMSILERAKHELGPRAGVRQAIKFAEKHSKEEFERDHSSALPPQMAQVMEDGRAAAQKVNG